jgi:hypothetical protein
MQGVGERCSLPLPLEPALLETRPRARVACFEVTQQLLRFLAQALEVRTRREAVTTV